jgi:hypothetical protein
MDLERLSIVEFGDPESLKDFAFENAEQHRLFRQQLGERGIQCPSYPLTDIDTDNFDDWLLMHQVEHQFFASVLDLSNPFNMLDADFRKEDEFYEWVAQHYSIHTQIIDALGL